MRFPRSGWWFLLGAGCTSGGDTDLVVVDDTDVLGDGVLAIDPCDAISADFGNASPGELRTKTMRLVNTGLGGARVESLTMEAPFSVGAALPAAVAADGAYLFTVRFQPTDFGEYTSELTVGWTSGGDARPDLTCTFSGHVPSDSDGDGYDSVAAGGADCDDGDADIHPDAVETWYDGIDADCDGGSDFDQDGDGHISEVFEEDLETGGDCQDANDEIFPGADDVPYDGVDSNCDGIDDFDGDEDGYPSSDYGGDDCDDADPLFSPAAVEVMDGNDNNCDGLIDNGVALDADITLLGRATTEPIRSVATGDWDDDGVQDLALGAPTYNPSGTTGQGALSLFFAGDLSGANEFVDGDVVPGAATTDGFGWAIADIGDFDGDGRSDLAASSLTRSSNSGRVYVFTDVEAGLSVSDAVLRIDGGSGYQLGASISSRTDLDADGLGDLIAFGYDKSVPYNSVAIQYGGSTGLLAWTDIDATLRYRCETSTSYNYCWRTPSVYVSNAAGGSEPWSRSANEGSDFDGDGYDDLLLGDPYHDGEAANSGRVWMLWGRGARYGFQGATPDEAGSLVLSGEEQNHQVGSLVAPAGDVDQDGTDDFWIREGSSGELYLFYGGPSVRSGVNLAFADGVLKLGSSDALGRMINAGDWTGDGRSDRLVSVTSAESVSILSGVPVDGEYNFDDFAWASVAGSASNVTFASFVPGTPSDLNGDGLADLVVGDVAHTGGKGAVHLLFQQP